MADPQMVDFSDLFDKFTEDSHIDESNKYPTVPTRVYEATLDQAKRQKGDKKEFSATFERDYAFVGFPALVGGKKLGRVSFRLSWEERRGSTGRPDQMYQLYNNLKGSLSLKTKSAGDVLAAAFRHPLAYNVLEGYWEGSMDDGTLQWIAVTDVNRKDANKGAKNIVNRVVGVKAITA